MLARRRRRAGLPLGEPLAEGGHHVVEGGLQLAQVRIAVAEAQRAVEISRPHLVAGPAQGDQRAGEAVFSTHRLAGPLIALRRACDEVRTGNLDRPLRFRHSDPHLGELETAFNDMVAALRKRLAEGEAGAALAPG